MFRRGWISFTVVFVCGLIIASDFAWSVPRRRRRANYNYGNTYGYGESGFQRVAPKTDFDSAEHRPLAVNYSYERAMLPEVAYLERLRVFVDIWDQEVLDTDEIMAEVEITDLSDSQSPTVKFVPVTTGGGSEDEYRPAVFDLSNASEGEPTIKAAKVYRLFVNLHRKSEEYGDSSMLGRVPVPYYVATSGFTALDRARQRIVMRTFREFYYTERGWHSGEAYPMDCYAYYMWATGVCTVGASNNWTVLGNLFNGSIPYHGGFEIPELSANGPIHGDYVRQPGHSFMLLAYDPKLEQVWTMEANFNSTIEVINRYVGSGWTVGHLVPAHIRPNLFTTVQLDASAD